MASRAAAAAAQGEAMDAAERELWDQLRGPRPEPARQALFRKYQPLARRIAWRFMRDDPATPVEFAELLQLASLGLLEAIDRYSPDRAVPFRYYCPRRIGGAIADGVARLSEVNAQITTARRIKRERTRSLAHDRAAPTDLAGKLDLIGDIAAELALGLMLEGSTLYLEDERDPARDAYETLAWTQALRQVRTALETLPERDRMVIGWHYLDGLPFDEIARLHGLTKGRISQIHKAALALLRKRLSAGGLIRVEG